LFKLQEHPSFSSCPPLPEEGALPEESALSDNEAPETVEKWEFEDSMERTESNQSVPSARSKGGEGGRKRRRQEDLQSSGTSKTMDAPSRLATSSMPKPIPTLFNLAGTDS
jgi:hypothetical protein